MGEKLEDKVGQRIIQISCDDVFRLLSEGAIVYRIDTCNGESVDLGSEKAGDIFSIIDEFGDLGEYVYFILKENN